MKKILSILILGLLVFGFSIDVYAASASFSLSASKIKVGDNFTIDVDAISVATWDITVSASGGGVSNCSKTWKASTKDSKNENRSFSIACVAKEAGTITVTMSGTVGGENDETATAISGTKTITVTDDKVKTPETTPATANEEPKKEEKKSDNNKIKEITVEGFDLFETDDNTYTLTVANDIERIIIKATAEDSKATITGIGEKEINVGDNDFEVVVTAENGSQNKISIKVIRKETKEEVKEEEKPVSDVVEEVEEEKEFNLIPIIMIGLVAILFIAVIGVSIKNKKAKEQNN